MEEQQTQQQKPVKEPTQGLPYDSSQPVITSSTPLEYLQGALPKQAITILILGLISIIAPIGLLGIQYLILGMEFIDLIPGMGYLIMGFIFFSLSVIIYKSVIKKGDIILTKKVRGGLVVFDKIKYGKKILFNRKDPTTELKILWSGAGTAEHSGAKVLLVSEGSAANENMNLCVAESDWTKNLSSMVRAKTYADIAESELLENKGLFGLKWQDIALIIIALISLVTAGILIGLTPDMVTENVMEALNSGALQHAIQSVVTSTPVAVV